MSPKSFERTKSNISKLWSKAKETVKEKPLFSEIPDGTYIAVLTNAEIRESDRGWLHTAFEWTVVQDCEQAGETVFARSGLDREQSLEFLIQDLIRLGVEVDDVEINDIWDLEDVLRELAKARPAARIRLKTKDEYQNVYINKLVDLEGQDNVISLEDLEEDDDVEDEDDSAPEVDEEVEDEDEDEEVDDEEEKDDEDDTPGGTSLLGRKVVCKADGIVCEVVAANGDDEEITVVDPDGDEWVLGPDEYELQEDEEDEDEDDDGDEADLEVGSLIVAEINGEEKRGKVISIDDRSETLVAKMDGIRKRMTLTFDEIEVLEG